MNTKMAELKFQLDPSQQENEIRVYRDASFGSEQGRKSTSGGIVTLQGVMMSFWARTQTVVVKSSCEAELLSCNAAAAEAMFLRTLLGELNRSATIQLLTDSSSAMQVVLRKGLGRLKHLEVSQLWLQDALRKGLLKIGNVMGQCNPADICTKPLPRRRLEDLCHIIKLQLHGGKEEEAEVMVSMLMNNTTEVDDNEQEMEVYAQKGWIKAAVITFEALNWLCTVLGWWQVLRVVARWLCYVKQRLGMVLRQCRVRWCPLPPTAGAQRGPEAHDGRAGGQERETPRPPVQRRGSAMLPFRAGEWTPYHCQCGLRCRAKISQNPNSAGRYYVSCPRHPSDSQRCSFFHWL